MYDKIKKKVENLIKNNKENKKKVNTKNLYAERVINLTKVEFNKEEIELSEKGIKYTPPKKCNKEEMLIECENIGRMEREEDKKTNKT